MVQIAPWTARVCCCAQQALQHQPQLADGATAGQQLPAEQLIIGSVVVVKPGDRVPADGTIVSGVSRVDESMLTGEPSPLKKGVGSQVLLPSKLCTMLSLCHSAPHKHRKKR